MLLFWSVALQILFFCVNQFMRRKKNSGFYNKAFVLQLTSFCFDTALSATLQISCVGRMLGLNSRTVEEYEVKIRAANHKATPHSQTMRKMISPIMKQRLLRSMN